MNWGSEELRDERRVVHAARNASGEAVGGEAFDNDRNAIRERDGHDDGLLGVRTAAETVVSILRGRGVSLILNGDFGAAQLRYEQVRCRPGQQEAGDDSDYDVQAD